MNSLLALLIGHYIGDFALQNEFIANEKSPNRSNGIWIHVMTAHCAIQAGTVLLATGRWELAIAEFMAHFAIDYSKCTKVLSFTQDHLLHLFCRVLWFAIFMMIK